MKNQIDDYYVFCQVAKYGSMKKASERVKLPLSTVSRRIVGLEQGLGVQLFIRSKNKLTLSNQGEKYFQALNKHLEAFVHSLDALHEDSGKLHGKVVISATKQFYLKFMYPYLKDLLKQNPDLSIELKNSHSSTELTEDVDIAVASGELPETNLIARKLIDVPLIFVASHEFQTSYQSEIASGEFNKTPYIGTFSHPTLTVLRRSTEEQFRLKIDCRLTVMDMEMVVVAVLDSLGYAVIPTYIHEDIAAADKVIEIFDDYTISPVRFSLLYRDKNLQTAAQRAVVESIMGGFQK